MRCKIRDPIRRKKMYRKYKTSRHLFSFCWSFTALAFCNNDAWTMVSFLSLPVELIIQVLSYLDIADLYNIADTCQILKQIINDEELWKNLFMKKFSTHRFSSASKSEKFSLEFFKRNDIIHRWRKATGLHKTIVLGAPSIEKLVFNYPKLLALSNQGSINIVSLDKGNTETIVPVSTLNGCTCYSFNFQATVFGRWDGKIFGKLLVSKSYLSSVTEFDKQHEGMVTSIYNDELNCYSGDENGRLYIWDLKTGTFIRELLVSNGPLTHIKALNNNTVITMDSNHIYVIEGETIKTIEHGNQSEYLEVDFGGKLIITGSAKKLYVHSYDKASFGRSQIIEIGELDSIHCISLERKPERNVKIAGYDGCNLGVVTTSGAVLIFNVRDISLDSYKNVLKPLCAISPSFDNLKVPNGIPPINSIAVNSTVVLLGSYNGFAAVYNVLTGEFLKLVSSRIPKRYLPLTAPPYLVPVGKVELGYNQETNGVLLVGNVVQYFQFGDLMNTYNNNVNSKKKKKQVIGVSNLRKDHLRKQIKHHMDEFEHEYYESYKKEQLLNKYNGDELEDQEQIELAMVLNASLHEQSMHGSPSKRSRTRHGKEVDDEDDDIDEDLAKALELSKLDQSLSGHAASRDIIDEIPLVPEYSESALESDFDEQLKEAMRRSLYE